VLLFYQGRCCVNVTVATGSVGAACDGAGAEQYTSSLQVARSVTVSEMSEIILRLYGKHC
jgi:hypothetical protein